MQNSLETYLEAADGAANVLAHARLLTRLARLFKEIAPPHLGEASRLVNYKSGTVVIHAESGAVATKLRQLAPTLVAGFCKRGVECSGVQIKVQARETSEQSRTSPPKPLTARAAGEIESLRDLLPESPLRAALQTFLERAARAE